MALRRIIIDDDYVLRQKCREVEKFDERLAILLDDMAETMRAADGCGLAAPQVGVLRRIAVVEVEEGKLIELINPKIIAFSGEQIEQEGCLSLPNRHVFTSRPMHVTVRALDRHGNTFDVSGSGLLARAFCHELDHLDGKLMIDRAAPADKIPAEEEMTPRGKARRRSR